MNTDEIATTRGSTVRSENAHTAQTSSQASSAAPTRAPQSAPPAIDLVDIHRSFGQVHAVDGVTLCVEQGELVALLGRNGAGKTTLIDIALGLGHQDSGTARLFAMAPHDAIKRGLIGVIQQTGGLPPEPSVRETVSTLASAYVDPAPVGEVLELAGITNLATRRIGKCSGGEQQRVRLAIALLSRPRLLIMDEPTAGMDVDSRMQFWQTMEKLTTGGLTVVFATHYLSEVEAVAHRIIIMNRGHVVTDESSRTLLNTERAHIRATVSEEHRDALVNEITALPGADKWTYKFDDGQIAIDGEKLEPAALAVLNTAGIKDFQMKRTSLDEMFTRPTGANTEESDS